MLLKIIEDGICPLCPPGSDGPDCAVKQKFYNFGELPGKQLPWSEFQ